MIVNPIYAGGGVPFYYEEIVLEEDAETISVTFDETLPEAFVVSIGTKDWVEEIGTSYSQHRTICQCAAIAGEYTGYTTTPVLTAQGGYVSRWDSASTLTVNRQTNTIILGHQSHTPQVFRAGWKYILTLI